MNTWNSGSWTIHASCCSRFSSITAVPTPLPCQKPCKASCRTMVLCSRLFKIDVQTSQTTSTSPMTLQPPPPFGISTTIFHIIASRLYPARNATCVILNNLSHLSVSGSFSLVDSCIHVFRCSEFMPDEPPACPVQSFHTAAAISSPSRGPYTILTGCTRIGSGYPYGGLRM